MTPPDRWAAQDTGAERHPVDALISQLLSPEVRSLNKEIPKVQRQLLAVLCESDRKPVLRLSEHYVRLRVEEVRAAYNLGHEHGTLRAISGSVGEDLCPLADEILGIVHGAVLSIPPKNVALTLLRVSLALLSEGDRGEKDPGILGEAG